MCTRSLYFNASENIIERAGELRKNLTNAEIKLWNEIKANKCGVKFRRQHAIENYIVDFYCHEIKLVIEIDGEIYKYKKSHDKGREEEIKKYGIEIIRFANEEIENEFNIVIYKIKKVINNLRKV